MKFWHYILLSIGLLTSDTTLAQSSAFKAPSPLQQILNTITLPEHTTLQQSYRVESPFASHYTFAQIVQGKVAKYHGVTVHMKKNGSHVIQNFLNFAPVSSTYTSGNHLILHEGELQAAYRKEVVDIKHPVTQWVREDGLVLLEKDVHKYIKRDTNIFVKVFMVNPINSSGKPYGGDLVDADDQTNSTLDSQLIWREVLAKFDNDSFFLESEFLYFEDVSLPLDTFYYATKDSLMYTRDIDAFEYLNVYYHINTLGEYVNRLGYDDLTDTLVVDVHAFNNFDNSSYTPSSHLLQFGEGGIDDAEDGEVVVHEFTHSLSELASPDNTVGVEREAMEEGSCDYFAKAYSRSINDNTPNKVFSWDGNETWSGIPLNTNRLYPQDLKRSKDGDRDMWSSVLMCAHDFIGREAMDSLLLEHFYYQGPNTTMAQMAQVILDIDSMDFGGRYYSPLKQCFVDAGFVQRGANVRTIRGQEEIYVLDQLGFARGYAKLKVVTPKDALFTLYTATGQKLYCETHNVLSLSPANYNAGLYIVTAELDGKLYSFKIIR
jgi:hypothetical protein